MKRRLALKHATKKHMSKKKRLIYRKKTMKGGVKWRAGADTCVFKPQVACDSRNPTPSQYRGDGYLSRVVKKGLADVKTEEFIRNAFPGLVTAGIINVQLHSCTPRFQRSNLNYTTNKHPSHLATCDPINESSQNEYVNMITKVFNGGDMNDRIDKAMKNGRPYSLQDLIVMLRGALNAAVALVPDKGPWVIHADCHYGNILYDETAKLSALADWGRCIIIEDPHNPMEVGYKLQKYRNRNNFKQFEDFGTAAWYTKDGRLQTFDDYPQHPKLIFRYLAEYYNQLKSVLATNPNKTYSGSLPSYLTALRGWTSFSILNILFKMVQTSQDLTPILSCESQLSLQNVINESIGVLINKANYIKVAEVSMTTLSSAPITRGPSLSLSVGKKDLAMQPVDYKAKMMVIPEDEEMTNAPVMRRSYDMDVVEESPPPVPKYQQQAPAFGFAQQQAPFGFAQQQADMDVVEESPPPVPKYQQQAPAFGFGQQQAPFGFAQQQAPFGFAQKQQAPFGKGPYYMNTRD